MGGLSVIVGAVAFVPACLAVALRSRVPWVVTGCLSHIAATGFLVAFASSDRLAPHTTWLLQKRADGTMSAFSQLMFWPYHLGLRGKLWIQRRNSQEPLFDKVTPQLYIGGWPEQATWLPAVQPSVVDVTCELPKTHNQHYLNLPCWDTQAPNADQIQEGVEWVQREMADGRPVYVHCAHGHGRSATVLAAVLMATEQAGTAEEAVGLMRAARPLVRLNGPQAAAVRSWIAKYCGGRISNGPTAADAQVLLGTGVAKTAVTQTAASGNPAEAAASRR